jgi:hypothetical protein
MQSATRLGTGREVENQPARNLDDSDGRRKLSANGTPGSPELATADAPSGAPRVNLTSKQPLWGYESGTKKLHYEQGILEMKRFKIRPPKHIPTPTPLDCGNI